MYKSPENILSEHGVHSGINKVGTNNTQAQKSLQCPNNCLHVIAKVHLGN